MKNIKSIFYRNKVENAELIAHVVFVQFRSNIFSVNVRNFKIKLS